MWICNRCQVENRDSSSACENCGAVRPAGRFGSAPARTEQAARAPRVSAPAAQNTAASRPSVRETYQPPETGVRPRPPRRPLLGFARAVGTALLILLPLLCALLSWRQYGALSPVLTALLLPADGAAWMGTACYILLSLIAVLLSALPGLWTLLFSSPPRPPRK